MITIYDSIGLSGIALSSFCYARVQWHRDYAKELSYSLLNLLACALLFVSLLQNWNLSSFVNNAVWALISAYGIYRCLKYKWRARKALRTQP